MKLATAMVLGAVLGTVLGVAAADLPPVPSTPKKPVTDEYTGGVKIVDDYRWLEPASSKEAREWSNLQNARTRTFLDHLPIRPAVSEALTRLLSSQSTRFSALSFRGGTLFG